MTRYYIFILYLLLLARTVPAAGQTLSKEELANSQWKTFYPAMKDTLMMRYTKDSLIITTSTGAQLLVSGYKLGKNIITFHDGGGLNGCPDLPGSYHLQIAGDVLTLQMDEDPCDGRGSILISKKWIGMNGRALSAAMR